MGFWVLRRYQIILLLYRRLLLFVKVSVYRIVIWNIQYAFDKEFQTLISKQLKCFLHILGGKSHASDILLEVNDFA